MAGEVSNNVSQLRAELGLRSRAWARGRAHVESYGNPPVIVYEPEQGRHGNFFDVAYAAIMARPEWSKRLGKVHTGAGRSLPRPALEPGRQWRELDSSMSSDALLMNVFCTPGVADSADVRNLLGVEDAGVPEFGWRARVPLRNGRLDRTEVDMRWDGLLVEAKLSEADFQTQRADVVEAYQDFDAVFEREALPQVELRTARRRQAVEFAEEFTQEWEAGGDEEVARAFQADLVERSMQRQPAARGYAGYQLIRNVLAAHAQGASFCVVHDERRPDLREAWFSVMAAVRCAALRARLKVLTWQELTAVLPEDLRGFLSVKYGIVRPGDYPDIADSMSGTGGE